jgi:N-acetylglutamate synthase-like GNAT family acetyltransferase
MTEPLIRPAKQEDLEKMARLYEAGFPEHIMVRRGILNNPDELAKKISDPDQTWVVADTGSKIIGVAALAVVPPVGLGEIERVCVAQPFRGNGVAKSMCSYLVEDAIRKDIGFVEAFARGTQPAMQKTFDNLGFKVYGIAPRFEVMHDDSIVREPFVHMGRLLKPGTLDLQGTSLIKQAQEVFDQQKSQGCYDI